jgi:hypothetical protein
MKVFAQDVFAHASVHLMRLPTLKISSHDQTAPEYETRHIEIGTGHTQTGRTSVTFSGKPEELIALANRIIEEASKPFADEAQLEAEPESEMLRRRAG